jgi:hypothetical protein
MPSPLGHALGGLVGGWLAGGRPGPLGRQGLRDAAVFAAAGMAADLDLLVGAHSGPSHGVGAAVLVGLAVYAVTRRGGFSFAVACAYATHTLLDWLGHDTSPPIGIMALWPFKRTYYESSLHLFDAITRRYRRPGFWAANLRAVVKEAVILGPAAALAAFARRR